MTKKFLSILLVICLLFSTSACTASNKTFDEQIIEISNNGLAKWDLIEGRTFSVSKDKDEVYHIDINGDELLIKLADNNAQEGYIKTNAQEYNSKLIEKSRGKIIDYINASNILKDKEVLIEYINNVPFKTADYTDEIFAAAEYDLKEDCIFINNAQKDALCEWLVVHELMHALCQKTNGGLENLRYPYDSFNEALTDILTASLNPNIPNGTMSGYIKYYQWVCLYLGCVGIDGIEAYFYGYDKILTKIPEEELDIFVKSIDQIGYMENAIVIVSNCINDWGLEK